MLEITGLFLSFRSTRKYKKQHKNANEYRQKYRQNIFLKKMKKTIDIGVHHGQIRDRALDLGVSFDELATQVVPE